MVGFKLLKLPPSLGFKALNSVLNRAKCEQHSYVDTAVLMHHDLDGVLLLHTHVDLNDDCAGLV
jgi:hypothetical protein